MALPGGWVVSGAVSGGGLSAGVPGGGVGQVLDRAHSRYVRTAGYDEVLPAPTGTVTAVRDESRPRQVGFIDTRRATVRWVRVGAGARLPQWSPDGRRLALTGFHQGRNFLGVLDLDGRYRDFTIDPARYFCTDVCAFTWTRDGRELTLPLTDRPVPFSERDLRRVRRGVQFFSADDGRPTRFVAIPGDPAGPWAWSPDGRYVVVQGKLEPQLVDAVTGAVLRTVPTADVAWVTADRMLYRLPYGSGDVVLAGVDGRQWERQPLPKELVGRTLTVAPR
ncbi:TolB family protein [Micromonospora sp. NPDC000089]|uniref:TolB family protein n=1 Tax=unclassified Micromonospora TaxID=2617518 RepID=UPI00367F26A6